MNVSSRSVKSAAREVIAIYLAGNQAKWISLMLADAKILSVDENELVYRLAGGSKVAIQLAGTDYAGETTVIDRFAPMVRSLEDGYNILDPLKPENFVKCEQLLKCINDGYKGLAAGVIAAAYCKAAGR